MLIKPGSVNEIRKSKKFKDTNPYIFNDINDNITFQLRSKKIENGQKKVKKELIKMCPLCNEYKPLRAHHCSICGICVLKMDHHCPWINNCVGQNNLRYFILFLTHTILGTTFVSILSTPIFFTNKTSSLPVEFNFVCVFCLSCFFILLVFNTWNWFLCLNGNTTIEFWTQKTGFNQTSGIRDFALDNWRDNLYFVFGNKSLIKNILFPSIKMLPFSGLEWSRILDKDFLVKGISDKSEFDYITLENELLRDLEI